MGLLKKILPPVAVILLVLVVTVGPGRAFTLEECVELALRNNPDLDKQQLNLQLAHADMVEQKARSFGNLDIVSSYTHYNLPHTLAPMTPASISSNPAAVPTTEDLFSAGVVYEVALFTGFARTRAIEIIARQSQYEQTKAELELKRALAEAVFRINTAASDYNSARAELAMTRESAAIEQVRFEQGAADISDILHARARHQLAESRFIDTGYRYKTACFYLDYLLEHGENR
ncbi:MAG: TolC family protein [Desulfobacterales bacterium]|nr:TolC family protein [Desulfobacterales bacterium]